MQVITNYGHFFINGCDVVTPLGIGKSREPITCGTEGVVHVVGYGVITLDGIPIHIMSIPFSNIVFLDSVAFCSYCDALNFCVRKSIPADYCVMQSVVNNAIIKREGDRVVAMAREFRIIDNILICDEIKNEEPEEITYNNKIGLYEVKGSEGVCAGVLLDKVRYS